MANPNTIPFKHYQDIHIADETVRSQFISQFTAGHYTEALNILSSNATQLGGKAFIAAAINPIIAGISVIQNLYYDSAPSGFDEDFAQMQAVINDLLNAGEWSNSQAYEKNNFVYNSNNEWYMCIADVDAGTPLTDDTHWLFLGLIGPQGTPGIEVSMKYEWDSSTQYEVNDAVTYGGNTIWVAQQANTNVTPGSDETTWVRLLSAPADLIHVGDTEPENKYNNSVWFQTDVSIDDISTTGPIPGTFKRYVEEAGAWEEMYPYLPFTQIVDRASYRPAIYTTTTTIVASGWQDNSYTCTNVTIDDNSIVQIYPVLPYNSAQVVMYGSLSMQSVVNNNFTLTTNLASENRVDIPIQIVIVQ